VKPDVLKRNFVFGLSYNSRWGSWRPFCHAVALFFMYYNFCRKHQCLNGRTPAQAAGLADHAWTIDELFEQLG